MTNSGTVAIRSVRREIPTSNVHFAFGDGRLTYDCNTCGAQCCRGHGYYATRGRELQAQLHDNPYVHFFLENSRALPTMKNLPPGCFFLTDEGLCGIHARHGYRAKPEGCRLFPFNRFLLLHDHLIVAPHLSLCPLSVVPTGHRSSLSRHERLLKELIVGGVAGTVRHVRAPLYDGRTLLKLEREIVALSEAYLEGGGGIMDFIQAQSDLTRRLLPGWARSRARERDDAAVSATMTLAADLLGADRSALQAADPNLQRVIIAMTGQLRSCVTLDRVESLNRRMGAVSISLERAPLYVLAVYIVGRLARLAGMREVTYQTIMGLLERFGPIIWVIAHASASMEWKRNEAVSVTLTDDERPFGAQYLKIAKALTSKHASRAAVPLGSIIVRHNIWGDLERVRFLRLVGEKTAGRIRERGRRSRRERGAKLRPVVQQAVLSALPDEVLDRLGR